MIFLTITLNACSQYKKGFALLSAIIMIIMPGLTFAAQAVATVSKNVVAINEPFQLTISVDQNIDNNVLDLTPLAKNFIYGSPSISSSTSIINGAMTRKTEFNITVAGKAVGTLTIPSFQLKGMQTTPIQIQVIKSSQHDKHADDQAIQMNVSIDRQNGYIGETFTYGVELFIGTRIDSPTLQSPFGDGLDIKQVGKDQQTEIVRNGRLYIVLQRQYQITPRTSGNFTLEGPIFTGTYVTGNRWNSSIGIPLSRQAKNLSLHIKKKPLAYTGLWLPTSDLQLSQRWDPDSLGSELNNQDQTARIGEPITRTITLKIKNTTQSVMPNFSLDYPVNVRVYSNKAEYHEENSYTVMKVKQVVIPREEGKVILPALSINWFDTNAGKQKSSNIPSLTLRIISGINDTIIQNLITSNPTQSHVISSQAPVAQVATYWRWTTYIFAILWLGTLFMFIRKLKQTIRTSNALHTRTKAPSSVLHALETAVRENNALVVSTRYREWDSLYVLKKLRKDIDIEVTTMMASHYSHTKTTWNNTVLLKLLEKVAKVKQDNAAVGALKPLVPK
ncbi:BatD family protein [Candidatus Enterovibrio altilux]|uniref:BatD n=1 Tax=Candidatus Enterovibrio altilux TaxID=1927128 RepID=A0A291BBJ5_9GAMM|nr:BatD family protein [Candidatus Enterovibrio luxaltus]ATF10382.1 BatD [Candidatus Enterovibrio luxaltus]